MTAHPTDLLPGYVLGDLDGVETGTAETHLSTCPVCRAEVARLRDALFSLADELPGSAPPGRTWSRIQARRSAISPDRSQQPDARSPGSRSPAGRPPLRQRPQRLWLVAAATVVLALGTVVVRLVDAPSQQAVVRQWEAQGASRLTLSSRDGQAFGTLLVRTDGQALVVFRTPAPNGRVYQAWGRQASGALTEGPVSLGFTDSTVMQVAWRGYASVGISVEPAGGSPAPTHPLGRVTLPSG
ncbi:Regulator of SigK [Deinococcus saxicola]|uniref:anti-sigma factor n=1 Tax=Deinococcus saxicola TaxID=249406 RepID=UPI0039EE5009